MNTANDLKAKHVCGLFGIELVCYTFFMIEKNIPGISIAPDNRRDTPRPSYQEVRHITRSETAHHVWGDSQAGYATDRVYTSSDQLHVLEFDLPPGGKYLHSPMNQTVFGADVLYFVLSGDLLLANPENGEVAIAKKHEGIFFQKDTWNNGFNAGKDHLRVLEFFSPPPARGTGSEYAKRQKPLDKSIYKDTRWKNEWPLSADAEARAKKFHKVNKENSLISLWQNSASHQIHTLVETDYLKAWQGEVLPGNVDDFSLQKHETLIHCLKNEIWLDIYEENNNTFKQTKVITPGDAMFLPANTYMRILNRSNKKSSYIAGSGNVPENWKIT